jgi:hypothetical protein
MTAEEHMRLAVQHILKASQYRQYTKEENRLVCEAALLTTEMKTKQTMRVTRDA